MTEVLAPAVYEAWSLFSSGRNSVREIAKRFPELDIFPSSCIHDMWLEDSRQTFEEVDFDYMIFVQILAKDRLSYREYAYTIPMSCSLSSGSLNMRGHHNGILFDLRKAMFETCSLGKALQILKANFEYNLEGEWTNKFDVAVLTGENPYE